MAAELFERSRWPRRWRHLEPVYSGKGSSWGEADLRECRHRSRDHRCHQRSPGIRFAQSHITQTIEAGHPPKQSAGEGCAKAGQIVVVSRGFRRHNSTFVWCAHRYRLYQLTRQFNMRFEERVSERTRIARDLHDTLLQSFHGLLLRFQAVSNLLPAHPQEAKERLKDAIDQAAQAITEGRDAVQGLRAPAMAPNDLAQALSALGRELGSGEMSQHSPEFQVEAEGAPRELQAILRDEVYRIAGEAL